MRHAAHATLDATPYAYLPAPSFIAAARAIAICHIPLLPQLSRYTRRDIYAKAALYRTTENRRRVTRYAALMRGDAKFAR